MSNNNNPLGLVNTDAAAAAVPPRSSARESAALDSLLALHNNMAGGPGVIGTPLNTVQPEPTPAPVKTFVTTGSARVVNKSNAQLLYFSGRLKAGKDHLAAQVGAEIFSLAEPLYRLREIFFGEGLSKDMHGAREFLQNAGQFGRGEVSAKYPLGIARAAFMMLVRAAGQRGELGFPDVDWAAFGLNRDIWLDALLRRVQKFTETNPGKRVAVTNCRFKNEVDALNAAGWQGWHVCCSPATWEARIIAAGLDPKSAALTDDSERLAISLDAQAFRAAPSRKLRVVWSDEKHPAPSAAFHTPESFIATLV